MTDTIEVPRELLELIDNWDEYTSIVVCEGKSPPGLRSHPRLSSQPAKEIRP